jgi:hypothetical protein
MVVAVIRNISQLHKAGQEALCCNSTTGFFWRSFDYIVHIRHTEHCFLLESRKQCEPRLCLHYSSHPEGVTYIVHALLMHLMCVDLLG